MWKIQAKLSFIIILFFGVNILIDIFVLIEVIILILTIYIIDRISSIILHFQPIELYKRNVYFVNFQPYALIMF